jgi:hypothetical protein
MKVSGDRRESRDVLAHARPEIERPLNVDVPLTVSHEEDLLGPTLLRQHLDVVCDILGIDLHVGQGPSRDGHPSNVISDPIPSALIS